MIRNVTVLRDRVVLLFQTLAAIPSPLLKVGKVMEWLEAWLRSHAIGYQFDQAGLTLEGFERGNLISNVIPATPGCEALPIKGVDAHVDTVAVPEGVLRINVVVEDKIIRSDGRTILGADDKAGVVAILAALEVIFDQGLRHGPIQVLFTVGEERSMYGVRELDLNLVKATSMVSVDGMKVDTLCRGCPAKLKYYATFKGHAGHAALPEDTLNAGLIAQVALTGALNAGLLGNNDNDWGILRGSCLEETVFHTVSQIATLPPAVFPATNVVPGEAVVAGEFRSFAKKKLVTSGRTLRNIFAVAAERCRSYNGGHHGTVEFIIEYPYEPFQLPEGHFLVQNLLKAMTAAGIADADADLGPGATHANVFNQRDIPAVVLGVGGRNPHQTGEYVIIDELAKAAEVLVHYLTVV